MDLNHRPSGYEPDELPGCSTPLTSTIPESPECCQPTSAVFYEDRIGRQVMLMSIFHPVFTIHKKCPHKSEMIGLWALCAEMKVAFDWHCI